MKRQVTKKLVLKAGSRIRHKSHGNGLYLKPYEEFRPRKLYWFVFNIDPKSSSIDDDHPEMIPLPLKGIKAGWEK